MARLFYKFSLLAAFLISMFPWFTWKLDFRITWVVLLLSTTLFLYSKSSRKCIVSISSYSVIFIYLLILWLQKNTIPALIFGIGVIWIVNTLLKLRVEFVVEIFEFITKCFSILLGISLFFYILYVIGIPLPHTNITFSDSSSYGIFRNYYFFIISNNETGLRFSSVFLEPGHMTMGIAPLLYINRYNFRNKYVLILLIAQLFSFSLAGYATSLFGYIFFNIFSSEVKHSKKSNSLFFTIGVVLIALICLNYFSPNTFNTLILDRLKITDGSIAGYNRVSTVFEDAFNVFVHSSEFYIGNNSFDSEEFFYGHGNSGWQVFTYIHGAIGLLLCILAYSYPIFSRYSTKLLFGLSFVFFMLLFQNSYPMWWCMFINLTLGTTLFRMKYNLYNENSNY